MGRQSDVVTCVQLTVADNAFQLYEKLRLYAQVIEDDEMGAYDFVRVAAAIADSAARMCALMASNAIETMGNDGERTIVRFEDGSTVSVPISKI